MIHSLWSDKGRNRIREGMGGKKRADQPYLCRKWGEGGDNKSFWFGLIFRWGKCEQVYELRVKILVQMVGWGGQI